MKQVTPGHLVSLEKLWYPLIQHGCKQLVLQTQKVRSALHNLVHGNSLLIATGAPLVLVPVIIDDVRQHIRECATMMRALKNEGIGPGARYHCDLASGLKSKMIGVHLEVLGPILQHGVLRQRDDGAMPP